jgi:hypothetical protein
MENNLIYVYCVSDSPFEFEVSEDILGLRTMVFNNFYLIVKNVSENEYSEENIKRNLSNIKWVETNARDHMDVIIRNMENNTVIPFKFGTIYHSEESLKKFINDYSESFAENFQNIKDKEEWSVKIYCNLKTLSEQIDELSEATAALEKQIRASSPGKAYLLERKKKQLIEEETDRLCKHFGQVYFDEFKMISDASFLNNLLPEEYTGRTDTMILNASFLVGKNSVTQFKDLSSNQIEKGRPLGFIIEPSGPWPLFSFVSIKEKI